MNADGSDEQRITFGAGRYATPVWSPRGDLIAFTKPTAANSTSASCGPTAAASGC